MATKPASTMMIEMTLAKTGRSMKNFEITVWLGGAPGLGALCGRHGWPLPWRRERPV
jgi:hypothetical protein